MTYNFTNKMKTLFIALIVFGTFATSINQTQAQAIPVAKIMLIDFGRVTTESLVGQDVAAQLDANRGRLEARASQLDQELSFEREELERQQSIIAPDAFEERVRAFQQRQLTAQRELEELNGQHQRAAQQASIEIQRVLRPIIIEVMNDRGATMVLDKNTAYHATGGLDVTTTIIEKLNSALSSFAVSIPEASQ